MLENCIKWPRFLLKSDSFFIISECKRMCTYVSVLVKSVSFYFIQTDKIDFDFHMYKVDCVVNVSLKINSWLSSYFEWLSIDWKLFEETDCFLLFIHCLLSCSYIYAMHYSGGGGMCSGEQTRHSSLSVSILVLEDRQNKDANKKDIRNNCYADELGWCTIKCLLITSDSNVRKDLFKATQKKERK